VWSRQVSIIQKHFTLQSSTLDSIQVLTTSGQETVASGFERPLSAQCPMKTNECCVRHASIARIRQPLFDCRDKSVSFRLRRQRNFASFLSIWVGAHHRVSIHGIEADSTSREIIEVPPDSSSGRRFGQSGGGRSMLNRHRHKDGGVQTQRPSRRAPVSRRSQRWPGGRARRVSGSSDG
jgi:hypothetical protein